MLQLTFICHKLGKKGFYPVVLQLSKRHIRIQSWIAVTEKMTELLSAKILLGVESVCI